MTSNCVKWRHNSSEIRHVFCFNCLTEERLACFLQIYKAQWAVFECALDDLNKFKYCGNGTKGKWQGNDLDKGDHQFVMRVKDPQGNTKNLIDHKFVVGK